MSGLSGAEIAALAVATLINVATYGPPWMAALPGLGYRQSMVLTQTSTAISVAVPGGDAVGIAASYAMLRGWALPVNAVAVAVVVTGAWNQIVNVDLPMLALALLLLSGGSSPLLLTAGLIGIGAIVAVGGALVMVLRGESQARGVGERAPALANRALRLVRRTPRAGWGEATVRFRRRDDRPPAAAVGRDHRRPVRGPPGRVRGVLVALRATGVGSDEVTWIEALAAWGLIRLLTAVPVTPGGIGIVELGLATALVGFGAGNAEAVAAVLLYRVLTVVPTVALGGLLGLTWRRHRVPAQS